MKTELEGIGMTINDIVHVSGHEAIALCKKGAVLTDIREELETDARRFAVDPMMIFPYSQLKQNFTLLPKDKILIMADSVGLRSKDAVIYLKGKGYENVVNLAGGIVEWERDGHSVVTNPSEMLSGPCACMLKTKSGKTSDFK